MAISSDDIAFSLSGGTSNIDTERALGGAASSHVITKPVNNLFLDLTKEEIAAGITDYRCVYVRNVSSADALAETTVTLTQVLSTGADISMAIDVQNEIQKVAVIGSPTGGNFILNFEGENVTVAYNADSEIWKQNLIDAFVGVAEVDVELTVYADPVIYSFDIEFTGENSNHYYDAMSFTNSLTGAGTITMSVFKSQNGAPINQVAPEIAVKTATPLVNAFVQSSVEIGNLNASEKFPVWIKRTVSPQATSVASDGFSLVISGSQVLTGAANLNGAATITAAGSLIMSGVAELTGAGTVAAEGTVV